MELVGSPNCRELYVIHAYSTFVDVVVVLQGSWASIGPGEPNDKIFIRMISILINSFEIMSIGGLRKAFQFNQFKNLLLITY